MGKILSKMMDRLFVVLGALFFLQLPLFIHQYEHELIGHVAELKWQNEQIQKAATKSGKQLQSYLNKFLESPDHDFSYQGKTMVQTAIRFEKLSHGLLKLQKANALSRPFVFIRFLQADIFLSTFHHFEPGLNFTREACFYAICGMLFGFLLFVSLKFCFKKAILDNLC